MGISQCWGLSFETSLEAQPLFWACEAFKCTKKIWKWEFRTAPKYHSFLLAAVLGVLDGFLPQALLDEFIFCKIRRGIKNKPVLILSSREKVLKLKNCLPLGEATLRQYLGVVRNMLHPHKNKPLCPYSSVTLCISKIHWSSLGNLAAHLKHGANMFFFLLGGGTGYLGWFLSLGNLWDIFFGCHSLLRKKTTCNGFLGICMFWALANSFQPKFYGVPSRWHGCLEGWNPGNPGSETGVFFRVLWRRFFFTWLKRVVEKVAQRLRRPEFVKL